MHILTIKNLSVSIENKLILDKLNLEIKSGEIHVIMGPNGTGKSTLSKVIMGDDNYTILEGSIFFDGKDITTMPVNERAQLGIFLGMQNPIEIEGVTNADFLRTALSLKEKENFKLFEFIKELEQNVDDLSMKKDMIHRDVNFGFSGGERKKNEILQLYMLKPNTVLLDEIDSGLDVDSLRIVGNSVMKYYHEYKPAILLITHYERLLDYIKPTHVHIMVHGKIVKSGDFSLAKTIEKDGYNDILKKLDSNDSAVSGNEIHE